MKQLVTEAIVLNRTDYGEADRILTLLTPDHGKLSLLAKGVRRVKSKLAGGIELFSVSTITFIKGRGEVGTLISTRLVTHYGHIVQDLDRTMLGYELIKELHKITEDEPEAAYFDLLKATFEALNDASIPLPLIRFWFATQMLRLGGHSPNLQTDASGHQLEADRAYAFDFERMTFDTAEQGRFNSGHIKFLRLAFNGHSAKVLAKVTGHEQLLKALGPLANTMRQTYLQV
jgi:DNA repair protein RecO